MKNKIRKILSIIISLSFVFSLFAPMSVGAEFTDLQPPFSYKVDLLETLGMIHGYNDGTFRPDQAVSRVECMSAILKMMGIKNYTSYGDGYFSDMKSTDWGYEVACTAAELDIIKPDANGGCNPNGYTTVEHASIMFIRALGYELAVTDNNYLALAQNIGILKDVYNTTGNMTRRQLASMLYNAIHIRAVEPVSYSTNMVYSTKNDNTILWLKQHIYREKGIVNGNYLTTVGDIVTSLKEDEVMINGAVFYIGNTDAAKYLGYEVEYYAQRDIQSGEDTLLYIIPTTKNKEIVLEGEEAYTIQSDNVLYWTYYDIEASKRKNINLSDKVTVLYNGVKYYDFTLDTFKLNNGYIRLLDNDGNGDYDVVFVNCHESYTVSGFDREAEIINGYGGYAVEYGKYDYITIQNDTGQAMEITDINEGDTISVFKSKGADDYLSIIVSSKKVEGEIHSTLIDGGKTKLLVENVWYEMSGNAFTYDLGELKVGRECVFYLNYEDKICFYCIASNKEYKYGFLHSAKVIESDSGGDIGRLKVYTEDGVNCVYETTEYVRWNGDAKKATGDKYTFADVLEGLKDTSNSFKPQMIKFSLDDEGCVSQILTDAGTNYEYRNNYIVCNKVLSAGTYKSRTKSFDGNYFIDENTVMFSIPQQDENGRYNEAEFRILKTGDFYNDTAYSNISLYDLDDTNVCGAIAMSVVSEKTIEAQNIFIVTSVSRGVNEDDEVVNVLKGYFKGEEVTFCVKDGLDVSSVQKNMVLWIVLNTNGHIANFGRILDLETQTALDDAVSRINSESYIIGFYSYFLGNAYGKQNNYLSVQINNNNNDYVLGNFIQADVNVYYCDRGLNYSITPTSVNNIQASRTGGSRVFIRRCNGLAKDIIIIK